MNIQHWFDCADQATRDGAYWFATVPAEPPARTLSQRLETAWHTTAGPGLGKGLHGPRQERIPLPARADPIRLEARCPNVTDDDRTRTSVWEFDRPKKSEVHPTMKPVELWMHADQAPLEEGRFTLQRFCGIIVDLLDSSTKNGAAMLAMELSPKYCDVAVRRWEEFTGEQAQRIPA